MAKYLRVSIEDYEASGATSKGQQIGIARHGGYAPFACMSPVKLIVEENPLAPGHTIVYEKCQCGKIVGRIWPVLSEPTLVQDEDDCA